MTQTLGKSFKDMISIDVLTFVLKVTLIAAAVTSVFLFILWGSLISFVTSYLSWIPWEWLRVSGASVASMAIAYMLFIVIIAIVTSFLIEPLLIKLAKKHYPDAPVVGHPKLSVSLILSLKAALFALLIFLLTFPVMFIPLVGAVYILWLWSMLLKKPTFYDVSSLFIDNKEVLKSKKKKTTMLSMIAAAFNYIPILNIFAAVFAQILFLHHILGRAETSNDWRSA